jgi:uncharacterized protein (TIGR02599 family)
MKRSHSRQRLIGFTLVELLVSMAIISLLLLVLLSITDATRRAWSQTTGKVEQFRQAREAFESVTRRLSQATLNTYWDYDDPTTPTRYIRQSELRFISGQAQELTGLTGVHSTHAVFFQAPLGFVTDVNYSNFKNALNTWGYFLEFGDDTDFRPPFLGSRVPLRHRFRLMELMEPSESLTLYNYTSGDGFGGRPKTASYVGHEWFTAPLAPTGSARRTRVLAENVIALILLPKMSPQEDSTTSKLAPAYAYDSTSTNADASINPKNQLPPVMQVTLVATDEATFNRIQSGTNAPDFGLDQLFKSASTYNDDLKELERLLVEKRINYRIFSTNVSIRGAKWSREQKN